MLPSFLLPLSTLPFLTAAAEEGSLMHYLLESNVINVLLVAIGLAFLIKKLNLGDALDKERELIEGEFEDAHMILTCSRLQLAEVQQQLTHLEERLLNEQKYQRVELHAYTQDLNNQLEDKKQQQLERLLRQKEMDTQRLQNKLLQETITAVMAQTEAKGITAMQEGSLVQSLMNQRIEQLPELLPSLETLSLWPSTTQAESLSEQYALALWKEAGSQATVLADDLSVLTRALQANTALQAFIASPNVTISEKKLAFETVLTALNASSLLKRFLTVLIENKRLVQLPEIAASFNTYVSTQAEVLTVSLAASPLLSAEQEQALKRCLKEHLQVKDVQLLQHDAPELIHGLSLVFNGYRLNVSFSTALQQLKERLLAL